MKRILIVEDDVSILSGLRDVLIFKSYDVVTAEDGESGYAAAVGKKPDLIILDIMIPKMDGFALCRKLREEGCGTPVLMLTAKGEEPDKVRGLDIGLQPGAAPCLPRRLVPNRAPKTMSA